MNLIGPDNGMAISVLTNPNQFEIISTGKRARSDDSTCIESECNGRCYTGPCMDDFTANHPEVAILTDYNGLGNRRGEGTSCTVGTPLSYTCIRTVCMCS